MLERLRLVARAWKHRLRKDPAEIALIRTLVKPGHTCLDIGSHKGAYTYWMHQQAGPTGRVICFEPQPTYAALSSTLWAKTPSVTTEHLALSDHAGDTTLYVPPWGPSPGASLEQANVAPGATPVHVTTTTLDAYAQSHDLGAVHFIKCDVEGHELAVLRGARGLLATCHPIIMLECEARFGASRNDPASGPARVAQVFAFLHDAGYEGCSIHPQGTRPLAQFSIDRDQAPNSAHYVNDFLFLPRAATNHASTTAPEYAA